MTLLVAPLAAAGVPVSLPSNAVAAEWEDAAIVADVEWVPTSQAIVQISDLGVRWEVRCECRGAPRSVRVNKPRTPGERLDVAVMARALGRELRASTPPLQLAPPPPPPAEVRSTPPPSTPVGPPPQVALSAERPTVAWVHERLPDLPAAPPRPVLPDYVPLDRSLTLPQLWVGMGIGLRPRTNPSLRMSGGVTILNGRHLSMGISGTAITSRSLSGFNKRPWHDRKMWEAGAHIIGAVHVGEWLQCDAGIGATRQAYQQGGSPLLVVTVPQVTADIEVRAPGDRRVGLRVGTTADLRGVALVDELTSQQQWLIPFEFRASVVARIGRRPDPTRDRPTLTEHRPDSAGLFDSDDLP